MRCPKCGFLEDKVIDSRQSKDGLSIRRRRVCLGCEHRFTTYEEIERADVRVVKRDGRHEPFDRHKLMSGMLKACEKRPVSLTQVEQGVEEIISELENDHGREVSSQVIGGLVMQKLHEIDPVAYVRYASVYRRFEDIGEFIDEIQSLERRPRRDSQQAELFPNATGPATNHTPRKGKKK